jgi:hypothetical protein
MASADGKSNPFLPDGKGGAIGNQGRGDAFPGLKSNVPPSIPQKHGSDRNKESVAQGGPFLTACLDAPNDRQGQVGTTADAGQRRPFKLNASGGQGGEQVEEEGPGEVGLVPPDDEEAQD